MLQYSNAFSCAINHTDKEIILNFIQKVPVVEQSGEIRQVSQETVSSLILQPSVARGLAETILSLLDEPSASEASDSSAE